MKTITFKADEHFDALLSRLAERTHRSKSALIREAVVQYERQIDREALRKRLREASMKTRQQAGAVCKELDSANADGL